MESGLVEHILWMFHYASIQQTLLAQVYQVQLDTHTGVNHHIKDLETQGEKINGMKINKGTQ